MNINKIFELSTKFLWPAVRKFVNLSRRCKTCILSEACSPLDKDGICAECRQNKNPDTKDAAGKTSPAVKLQFETLIHSYINDNGYHALLLLSGGKDSAYILDRMRREFPKLKILCVLVNNGFMSPVATESARYIAEKSGADLLIANSHVGAFAKVLRQAFLDLKGRGCYSVVDKADGDMIFEIGRQIASDMKIPLMLAGLSWVQLQKIFGTSDFKLEQRKDVLSVFPLAVWKTSEHDIRSIVQKEKLLPPGSDSPIVSNSALVLSMAVVDVLNNGYSSFEPEFAQLVREGKTDRKTWLYTFEQLEFAAKNGFLSKDLKASLGKLGLSVNDIVRGKK